MIKKLSLFVCLILMCLISYSQLRVMSYNLLNFPTGNFQGRVDTLQNIIDYYRPHLLMVQELQNEDGLNQITDMMNELEYGNFASGNFVQQQSDPFNPYYLQQNIVFDQNYLTLKNQLEIITDIRDVNYFRLYFNDNELANGADTTYLHVFVTHLKSSSGSANEQLRLQMVEQFITYIENNLDETDNILFAGDFNLYDTAEPAYQALINENNVIAMQDPFSAFGNWAVSNFQHREILTQSTRASQIGNDGAGGGLDDRFDFILFSPALMNSLSPVHFIEGTFKSLGNNGTCYNQSITNCASGNEVPTDVLQSIYYMSDHIPQVCEIEVALELGVKESHQQNLELKWNSAIPANTEIAFTLYPYQHSKLSISIFDINGRECYHSGTTVGYGPAYYQIPITDFSDGMYMLHIQDELGTITSAKFIIKR